MITPAPRGLVAIYERLPTGPDSGFKINSRVHENVIAWDDEGHALILDEDKGRLVRADSEPRWRGYKFVGVFEAPHPAIVNLIPAGGWRVKFTWSDGSVTDKPLVGWGVDAVGGMHAIDTDLSGEVSTLGEVKFDGSYRIYHPDIRGE